MINSVLFSHSYIPNSIQPMKFSISTLLMITLAISCTQAPKEKSAPLIGTWQLISATSTQKDSTVSTFDPKTKMLKLFSDTHFAFFLHDLHQGKDSSNAVFSAGSGLYELTQDSIYTEHLEYCNNRKWETNSFHFVLNINGDTLIQKGVEKIADLGVDHIIVEKYIRVKK